MLALNTSDTVCNIECNHPHVRDMKHYSGGATNQLLTNIKVWQEFRHFPIVVKLDHEVDGLGLSLGMPSQGLMRADRSVTADNLLT